LYRRGDGDIRKKLEQGFGRLGWHGGVFSFVILPLFAYVLEFDQSRRDGWDGWMGKYIYRCEAPQVFQVSFSNNSKLKIFALLSPEYSYTLYIYPHLDLRPNLPSLKPIPPDYQGSLEHVSFLHPKKASLQ